MAKTPTQALELDKEKLVTRVEKSGERYLFFYGEGFRYEKLPVGTRVVYPPPPLPPIEDVDAAIEQALENPLDADPLSAQLRAGMKLTIAFDDISLPLPPMRSPDIRKRVIEKVVAKATERGVEDIHLIAALGLHRSMTPGELRGILGRKLFNQFHPDRLYNFDAEDKENLIVLGKTSHGQEVEISRRVGESDLLVYVNINLVSMDGGEKSINTGLVSYRSIRHHHNVNTLMHSESYMDPTRSALHDACQGMQTVVDENLKVFKIETAINTNAFPSVLRHLQMQESEWKIWDRATFHANRLSLDRMPFQLRWNIFQKMKSPYGMTDIAAGATAPVHDQILSSVYRQQAVPVSGQADVMVLGMPYLSPYNVNSYLNPILVHVLGVGYVFNLYRGKPLVRRGGVMIFTHPLEERFNETHHPSYVDFYNNVLTETRDAAEIESRFEEEFAHNQRYIDLYRNSYAYHGVHPFYMWYWACYGQDYLGRIIVVGAKDKAVADRLGYETAPNMEVALAMAQDTVGNNPEISMYHFPPIFLCDVD